MPAETTTTETTLSEPAEVTTSATTESQAIEATPESADDLWANIDFNKSLDTDNAAVTETATGEVENPPTPLATATEETENELDETETEQPLSAIPRLSRKDLRSVEERIITPFRDRDTPADQVWEALNDYSPTRANAMAAHIIGESIQHHADKWMSVLIGTENVTVEEIKDLYARKDTMQSASSTTTANGLQKITDFLTTTYGEDWRDSANDDYLVEEHQELAAIAREKLTFESTENSELKTKLTEYENKLKELAPQVDEIKQHQQTVYENKVKEVYTTSADGYKQAVEKASLDNLFPQVGLDIKPEDSDSIKSVKSFIADNFKPIGDYSSSFDIFVMSEFSDKEGFGKIINRIDGYLSNAAKAEVEANQTKNETEATKLRRQAQVDREEAEREKTRATVLHQKASKEFFEKKLSPLMSVLKENAELQRRLNQQSGRVEVIGQQTSANSEVWRDQINSSANPFDTVNQVMKERLAQYSR